MKIHWRGLKYWPLIDIGKYTCWLQGGISFGIVKSGGSTEYFIGWLIVSKQIKGLHIGYTERLWILKYKRGLE